MTDLGILMGLLAFGAGLALMLVLGSRRPRRRPRAPAPDFDPNELAELSDRLARVAADHHQGGQDRAVTSVTRRLQPLISRRCPIRAISAAPVRGATRICFADGTTVLVRSQQGRLALLAHEATRYPVCLRSCRPGPEGPELTFDYYGGQLTAVLVGLDQAD